MDFKKLKVHSKVVSSNRHNKLQHLHKFVSRKPKVDIRELTIKATQDFHDFVTSD